MNKIPKKLKPIWAELYKSLKQFKRVDYKMIKLFTSYGWEIKKYEKHYKLYIPFENKNELVVIASTTSDENCGREIARQIRRIYLGNEK